MAIRNRKQRESDAAPEGAEWKGKKRVRIALWIFLAAVLTVAVYFAVTGVLIPDSRYKAAVDLYDAGRYDEAIAAFTALNGYQDSEAMLEKCRIGKKAAEETEALVRSIHVGDIYPFGAYEQDNKPSSGKEDIEWIVLEKDGTSLLLISKYALDCQQYISSYTSVTWESSALRSWLNGSFLNTAFRPEEQARIRSTTVAADENPSYGTSPGNDTTDKVFLLSIPEANRYFPSDEARKCIPTEYAIAQGVYRSRTCTLDGIPTCWWWLRSPGNDPCYAADVNRAGTVYEYGSYVSRNTGGIRPALWIDLGA